MLTPGNNREHLREYLRSLGSEKRFALLENIERAVLRGESIPDGDLILTELRDAIRAPPIKARRVGSPSRRFYDPVEPFIVDGAPIKVLRGQIARASLSPIWILISHDLLPKETKSYSDAVSRALGLNDKEAVAAQVESFRALALPVIRKALASQETKNWLQESLAIHMAPQRAIVDLREVVTLLTIRRAVIALRAARADRVLRSTAGDRATDAR